MDFDAILAQVREQLAREKRIAYRILQRRFQLTDGDIEDLKADLIDAKQLARDEKGKVLVWVGEDGSSPEETFQEKASGLPVSAKDQRLSSRSPDAERRQLTVMFCDLVGSTALSEQLDPEELRDIIRAYQDACRQVIERYEGYIAQYLGDGLLVYFGYPAAHEDDARRATQAGLEILSQLQSGSFAVSLQVRIGIHTGQVVIGEIGSGGKAERLALGETPNIAARVQGQAEPNTVAISSATYHLVQGFFACLSLGPRELKGLSTPLTLYHVQGEGEAQNRFDVSVQKGLTPLVGREEELEPLHRRWQRVKAGEGQVVLLSGEAGIGKSRLMQMAKEQVGSEPHVAIVCRCSPFYQHSALHPIMDHLQRFLTLGQTDTPKDKLAKLEHALETRSLKSPEELSLFASLLSLTLPEDSRLLNFSPQKQKEKTLDSLIAWLQAEAEQQPVWLEFENLHLGADCIATGYARCDPISISAPFHWALPAISSNTVKILIG